MSRHRYTVGLFGSLTELFAAFEQVAPQVEHDLFAHRNRYVFGELVPYEVGDEWGASEVSARAVAHADRTRDMLAVDWFRAADPREIIEDDEVTDLVAAVWRTVLADHTGPVVGLDTLPSVFEEKPSTIPRVAGVWYYPASLLGEMLVVPPGYTVAVAVRDEQVPDDDWEHICSLADPDRP